MTTISLGPDLWAEIEPDSVVLRAKADSRYWLVLNRDELATLFNHTIEGQAQRLDDRSAEGALR